MKPLDEFAIQARGAGFHLRIDAHHLDRVASRQRRVVSRSIACAMHSYRDQRGSSTMRVGKYNESWIVTVSSGEKMEARA
jgi:hypothetical protein